MMDHCTWHHMGHWGLDKSSFAGVMEVSDCSGIKREAEATPPPVKPCACDGQIMEAAPQCPSILEHPINSDVCGQWTTMQQ